MSADKKMDSGVDFKTTLPKFDGQDFGVWKVQVEAYLSVKRADFVLRHGKPRRVAYASSADAAVNAANQAKIDQKEKEIKDFEDKDTYVRSILLLALSNDQVRLVLPCKSAKEIWDRLAALHEQKSQSNRIMLQQEFFGLRMRRYLAN